MTSPHEIERLLVRADSLCSLILHRESRGLSDLTKHELGELVADLRRVTEAGNRARGG